MCQLPGKVGADADSGTVMNLSRACCQPGTSRGATDAGAQGKLWQHLLVAKHCWLGFAILNNSLQSLLPRS
jgi:hypothetical protein